MWKEKESELEGVRRQLRELGASKSQTMAKQKGKPIPSGPISPTIPSDHTLHIALNELDTKWRRELQAQQGESVRVIERMTAKLEEQKQQAEQLQHTVRDLAKQLDNERLRTEVVVKESLLEVNKVKETAHVEVWRAKEESTRVCKRLWAISVAIERVDF